jgi:hypothetical protein
MSTEAAAAGATLPPPLEASAKPTQETSAPNPATRTKLNMKNPYCWREPRLLDCAAGIAVKKVMASKGRTK